VVKTNRRPILERLPLPDHGHDLRQVASTDSRDQIQSWSLVVEAEDLERPAERGGARLRPSDAEFPHAWAMMTG
jgi:hypothetical protein